MSHRKDQEFQMSHRKEQKNALKCPTETNKYRAKCFTERNKKGPKAQEARSIHTYREKEKARSVLSVPCTQGYVHLAAYPSQHSSAWTPHRPTPASARCSAPGRQTGQEAMPQNA